MLASTCLHDDDHHDDDRDDDDDDDDDADDDADDDDDGNLRRCAFMCAYSVRVCVRACMCIELRIFFSLTPKTFQTNNIPDIRVRKPGFRHHSGQIAITSMIPPTKPSVVGDLNQ